MEKHGQTKGQGSILRSVLYGLMGSLLFFGLLLLAAALGDRHGAIMDMRASVTKGCLLISAIISALLAGKSVGQGRLLHALCAEGALMIVLLMCAMAMRSDMNALSIGVDLLLLLFGAFAGTMLPRKQRVKRRGKR